jgi:hypothetical protein
MDPNRQILSGKDNREFEESLACNQSATQTSETTTTSRPGEGAALCRATI